MRSRLVPSALLVVALAGCTRDGDQPRPAEPAPSPTASSPGSPSPEPGLADGPALDVALSEPVEDSLYPHVGDPGVDALHYDLVLDWRPATSRLVAQETLVFRATRSADRFQLDLAPQLEVTALSVDGEAARFAHRGKDLVVRAPVEADERYVVELSYSGSPEPAPVPTTRNDFRVTGWTTTESGDTWTMQEPFGAFTWYAVNDHPSDKALYDFEVSVPSPRVGVANGELVSREERGGRTVTTWHLAEPAASYLVTLAIGDFVMTQDRSRSGVPITYWTPRDRPDLIERLRPAAAGLDWMEKRLGPYPFDTLGIVLVDSMSGMETQTMITLGMTPYLTSRPVLVHEIAHHWYGNQVTPADWRDLWMNEGMAMYLQGVWEAERADVPVGDVMDLWAGMEADMRSRAGPPGDYDRGAFGEGNVYYGPALMWHELRERLGDAAFWEMVRAWPAANDNGHATREEYLAWIEEQTGEELTAFFDAWLLSANTPRRN